ncbi:MAG: SH3 domain-containing protein [Saprospiraceae bacterium]|nr:SH3 domain-containing protein [Saprospiraceae bacterium]MCF8251318.1 SH3 domain-containing protein [Saprospiraceae bacterium]MCF8280619.1 SH3 domain-containing protein [Bacteroidales bacterium]MCF8313193.1 SH3 domain-containing protein [Saprospiraceae bacterium]MCF8441643.1 SH3 domain-containing protein [Saprospiraceae bacterium]
MKGLLSKVEYIVIGVLALIFLMWTVSKCNAHKEEAQSAEAIETMQDSLANQQQTAATPPPIAQQPVQQPAAPTSSPGTYTPINGEAATTAPTAGTQAAQTTAPAETAAAAGLSKLYVTIDKLKVRKEPGLKGQLLGELKLFDEVYYMNEVTDSTYEVNLGKEKANEPYVKIKTKRGTVGWVYGAGVHYVKKKRSGTLD